MIIIRPVEITDTVLTFSDVPENDEAEWLVGTSYNEGDRVMRTVAGTHSVYISLQNGNIGNVPEDDSLTSPVYWARESATNRWAMFSNQISDQTEQADEINVTLTPAALVNAISFFNLDAAEVQIIVDDPVDGVVYDQTFDLVDDSGVNDWYAWYFEPIVRQRTLAVLGLPPYSNADIDVVVRQTGGIARCGLVSFGAQRRLGDTDYGSGIGIVDYSRKERDTFGNPVIVERNFSNRVDYTVTIETRYAGAVRNTLSDYRTTPMTFIGSENFPSTVVFGYYRDFNVVLSNPTKSLLSLEVEGLT